METKRWWNSQNNFEKEKAGGLNLNDFKTYYKTAITKAVCQGCKKRTLDNETEYRLK